MVQHAISAETPDRGIAARSRKGIEAQRIMETGVGSGSRSGPRRPGSYMVFKNGRFAAATNPFVAGFFFVVARIFQRRIYARRRGKRKILERSESAGTSRETCRRARSTCRMEPRRVRPCLACRRRGRRRQSRLVDQCDACGDRRPGRGAPALRHHGRSRPAACRRPFARCGGRFRESLERASFKKSTFHFRAENYFLHSAGGYCFRKISECAGLAAEAEATTFRIASRLRVAGGRQSSVLQAW